MPRAKSLPSCCIHQRSQRAYATIDGRQVQLGPANSPQSREAFDRLVGEWYSNGRQLLPATSRTAARAFSILIDRFWTRVVGAAA